MYGKGWSTTVAECLLRMLKALDLIPRSTEGKQRKATLNYVKMVWLSRKGK